MGRVPGRSHGVQASDEPADLAQALVVQLVEDAAADPGERRIEDPVDLRHRGPDAKIEGRHRRQLLGGQVGEERVLVEDGLARPASRPVELHDEAALVLQLDLVDAVLEGAQRQAAAGAAQAADLDRVEDAVGGQRVEAAAHQPRRTPPPPVTPRGVLAGARALVGLLSPHRGQALRQRHLQALGRAGRVVEARQRDARDPAARRPARSPRVALLLGRHERDGVADAPPPAPSGPRGGCSRRAGCGTSKFTTWLRPVTSMPRAAMSVATRTRIRPALNASRACVRCAWLPVAVDALGGHARAGRGRRRGGWPGAWCG